MLKLPKTRRNKRKKITREVFKWAASMVFAVAVVSVFVTVYHASAIVQPLGRLYYGDATNTVLRFILNSTYDFTFGAEQTYTHGASASLNRFIVSKTAPTRDEIMIGTLKADGALTVIKGINGYDVNTEYSTAWSNAGTGPAMTCEGTKADCTRSFDVAYEQLSGRAMVVYADNVNQKLYYCYYDGTNWGPVSTCLPTNGSNDISLTSNGRPTYVSVKAKPGSDELIMGVGIDVAGAMSVEAYRWSGSAWGNSVSNTTAASTQGLNMGAVFDVAWDGNDAMLIYATTATVEIKYKLWTGGSWGSEQDAYNTITNGSAVIWLMADSDPASRRIAASTVDNNSDFTAGVWKEDGSSATWSQEASDTTIEASGTAIGPMYTDVKWENTGSEVVFLYQDVGAGDSATYVRETCTGSGCTPGAATLITTTGQTNDAQSIQAFASRNSDDIMILSTDIDNNLITQHWNGSAWESGDAGVLENTLSLCSADNVATGCTAVPASFSYIPYSPWSRNWRFYNGTDTTNTPTTALANENTTPTGFSPTTGKFRLRFSVINSTAQGQDDARKKLQYASGASCTPDTVEGDTDCTWTDVDDPAGTGMWRYVDCGGAGICDDNSTLSATVLSGTPTAGWWTQLKSGGTVTAMDHTALQLRELEYSVEANGAESGTTYYFRMYDVDQGRPVLREQDNDGSNDCASAVCTYPSITTSGVATDALMRGGNYFSGGSEQSFSWAQ